MTINARVDLIKMCEFDGKVLKDDSKFSHHKQVHKQMHFLWCLFQESKNAQVSESP